LLFKFSFVFYNADLSYKYTKQFMVCFPNAKINIGLNIVEKRPDGFHTVESILYPVGLCDILEVVSTDEAAGLARFKSTGLAIPGGAENNLCVKAYELLSKEHVLPGVNIHLHKIIPIGAGLGGGSSDGAFFVKLLNDKFELGLSWGELHHYARQLGSDCSFFIGNRPAYAEGIGDQFEPTGVQLSGYHLVIVYPAIHISTAEAYSRVKPQKPERTLETVIDGLSPENWKPVIKNDFEDSAFRVYPLLRDIKDKLYKLGAVYASMSGSGSSVYGLFKTEKGTAGAGAAEATEATEADKFKKEFDGFFCMGRGSPISPLNSPILERAFSFCVASTAFEINSLRNIS